MKEKVLFSFSVCALIVATFFFVQSFSMYRDTTNGVGTLRAANWSVSRSQAASGDSIDLVIGEDTDVYNLTVQSQSEVDVVYTIIISNLPAGVEVSIDNGATYLQPTNGTLRISNAQTVINYNDQNKTKTHTLTFRAVSGAPTISNQSIDINVEFKQSL